MKSRWPGVMLMSAATLAGLTYALMTATEAPSQTVSILQYGLLAGALFGMAGSLVAYVSRK